MAAVVVEDELLKTDISCALLSTIPPAGEGAEGAVTLRTVFSAEPPLPSMDMTVVLGEAAEDDIIHRITGLTSLVQILEFGSHIHSSQAHSSHWSGSGPVDSGHWSLVKYVF